MSIDPTTLPDGTVVEIGFDDASNDRAIVNLRAGGERYTYNLDPKSTGFPTRLRTIARVFVPVPDGMTHGDAVAALADAGAWVPARDVFPDGIPNGVSIRCRDEWVSGNYVQENIYVHRDDLPPTDPDADLIEAMARAMCDEFHEGGWGRALPNTREKFSRRARAALAVVREHEAKP